MVAMLVDRHGCFFRRPRHTLPLPDPKEVLLDGNLQILIGQSYEIARFPTVVSAAKAPALTRAVLDVVCLHYPIWRILRFLAVYDSGGDRVEGVAHVADAFE